MGVPKQTPPPSAPPVPGEQGSGHGRFAAGLALPPRPGFAHESPASHGPRPPAATATGHAPGHPHRGTVPAPAPREDDGSRRGETASAERGHRRVRGCPGGLGTWGPLFPMGLPGGAPWRHLSGEGVGGVFRVQPAPQNPPSPTGSSPQPPLSPAGRTWGLHRRTGTTRCRERRPRWSWGHGAASTATHGGRRAPLAGSDGRAGSSTWLPASASSSWWEKLWVSGGCGDGPH